MEIYLSGHSIMFFFLEHGVLLNQQECVENLIKYGAGVETMESKANNKITPLMIAAERGHFQLAKVLIEEHGAEIERRGN